MFGEKPIKDLTIEQIRDELRTQYGMKDLSNCLGLRDLQDKLEYTRKTRLMTHGVRYGDTLYLGNTKNPTGVVVFTHGLGGSARSIEPYLKHVVQRLSHLLFVLPTSTTRFVTWHGKPNTGWYDIKKADINAADSKEIKDIFISVDYISSLAYTTTQRYRVPSGRVVYAGFSQGGAMSLATGLTSTIAPAGIVSLSGYLAGSKAVLPRVRNKGVPILICHGTQDAVVPIVAAEQTKEALANAGVKTITFKTFPIKHVLPEDVIETFERFVGDVLP